MYTSFFGTDGIRTRVGKSPLTPIELVQLGSTLGHWTLHTKHKKTIAIAHDPRISSALITASLKAGLLQHQINIIDLGILPTPALYYLVTQKKMYDIGIMITASHNEYADNGLKIMIQNEGKLSAEDEQIITQLYHTLMHTPDYENLGTELLDTTQGFVYTNDLLKKFSPGFLEGVKIVVDCAHGAYSHMAPAVFEALGATVTALHTTPTGKNINNYAGSQHPQVLQSAVITTSAHIGFAFDGDGDRVVIASHMGTLKDGDDILTVLLDHPAYKQEATLIGTIMSNQGFEHHLALQSRQLIRTAVGDKHVMHAMKKNGALLGAEPSGHVLLGDFSGTADGLFTALRMLEAIILTGNWNIDSFKKFSQCTINVPVEHKKDLTLQPFATLIEKSKAQLHGGRIVVRYSGTEPVLRVMVEDADVVNAQLISTTLSQELADSLSKESQ